MLLAAPALLVTACSDGRSSNTDIRTVDPFHPPSLGQRAPDYVVELELENRFGFDIIPTGVNGTPLDINTDHLDNHLEPLRIPPGLVRFVLTNTGTISHNLRLEGTTPDGRTLDLVTPSAQNYLVEGEMWELTMELWEGNFLLTCAVTNHDDRGMWRPMVVTSDAYYPPPVLRTS
jgi:hypothetical protein